MFSLNRGLLIFPGVVPRIGMCSCLLCALDQFVSCRLQLIVRWDHMSSHSHKPQIGLCALCGKRRKLTKDHIPPRSLFPKGTPLIKVQSCEECNQGSSKDDEFLRLLLTMPLGAHKIPQISPLVAPLLRSFGKREARGYVGGFLGSIEQIDVTTPGGVFLGRVPTFRVDPARITRILRKIVRGLFYKEFKTPLPSSHGVAVVPFHPMKTGLSRGQFAKMGALIGPLLNSETRDIGNGMFVYRFGRGTEWKYKTAWGLLLGNSLAAYAMTDKLDTLAHIE